MKVNDDILKSVENLNKLVAETNKLSEKMPSLMDSLVEKVPEAQQGDMLKFVQESNELLNKSKNMDFNDIQSLIKDYTIKYEQSINNK